jgi:vacuolar-type H+-ATPase subunit I/STV1
LSPEELVEQAGMDAIAHSEILNKTITLDDAADLEALEAKRQEMLATAKKFATTAAAMLDERKEAAHFVDNFLKREHEVDESLEKFKQLRKHREDKIS